MVKRLAMLLSLISVLLFPLLIVIYGHTEEGSRLTQAQLSDPAAITSWLREYSLVHRPEARLAFEQGLADKQQPYWSAAVKAFGESAISYPAPQALTEYAEALLRMLGEIRERRGETHLGMVSDMRHVLVLYQSVMAADTVLDTLSVDEKAQIQSNIACLQRYLEAREISVGCQPFVYYGI